MRARPDPPAFPGRRLRGITRSIGSVTDHCGHSGYPWAVSSSDAPRGRHRLAVQRRIRRPALMPRSATVIAATVGAVLVLGVQERVELPAPRSHPDAPAPALEPVIPAQRDGRPARIDPVPAGVTGRAIAGAHATGPRRSAPSTPWLPPSRPAASPRRTSSRPEAVAAVPLPLVARSRTARRPPRRVVTPREYRERTVADGRRAER